MSRVQLCELHELERTPDRWRRMLNDVLTFFALNFDPYGPVLPRLLDAIGKSGQARVLDLGSGAGGPAMALIHCALRRGLRPPAIMLTDKYPNLEAFRAAAARYDGVSFVEKPVDAGAIPAGLEGFRTIFSTFHHLAPDRARDLLREAMERGAGIGVFEYTERNILAWGLPLLLMPLFVWVATPLLRPLTLARLFWTYVAPVIPIMLTWDALVSCLRTYSLRELREMTAGLTKPGWRWELGRVQSYGTWRVTYLLGYPLSAP